MRNEAPPRASIAEDWRGVLLNQNRVIINTGIDALFSSQQFRDLCHSLILVHAYGVLQGALQTLASEGRFDCKSSKLGPLMQASAEQGLPWIDYELLYEGKRRRDDIAHEARYVSQKEARRLVALIQENLKSWGFEVRDLDSQDD
jgi:hypothetical protein